MSSPLPFEDPGLKLGAMNEMIKLNVEFWSAVKHFQKECMQGLKDPLDKPGNAARSVNILKSFLLSDDALVFEKDSVQIGSKYGAGLFVPFQEWLNFGVAGEAAPGDIPGDTSIYTDEDLKQLLSWLEQGGDPARRRVSWNDVVAACKKTLEGLHAYRQKQRAGLLGYVSILTPCEGSDQPESFELSSRRDEVNVYYTEDESLARMALELSLKFDEDSLERLKGLSERLTRTARMATELNKARRKYQTSLQSTAHSNDCENTGV
jgi:hypothetical protein